MLKGFEQVNVYVEGMGIVKKTVAVEDGIIKQVEFGKNLKIFIKIIHISCTNKE